jgi:hypothetical protein
MMKRAAMVAIPLLLAGCAGSLKSNFETDENEFPFILISQTGSLIPEIQKQRAAAGGKQKESAENFLQEYKKYIKDIDNNASNSMKNIDKINKDDSYNKLIENKKRLWEIKIEYVSSRISESKTAHLLKLRQYELRSDAFNVPVLGGLIAIATSAFFKASTDSVGGLAAGVGGLTASRDYFNVEGKRDLHLAASVGFSCLLNEGNRLYGSIEKISLIYRASDSLKDAVELGQRSISKLELQTDLTQNDKDTLTVMKSSLDAARKTEAIARRQITDYEQMPYLMLKSASDLQHTILINGGRGKIDSAKITDAVRVQITQAAFTTKDIFDLRGKLSEAKGGKLTVDSTESKDGKKKNPLSKVEDDKQVTDTAALDKKVLPQEVYAALVSATDNVVNAISDLGDGGEMSQVLSRITNCGAGLGKAEN